MKQTIELNDVQLKTRKAIIKYCYESGDETVTMPYIVLAIAQAYDNAYQARDNVQDIIEAVVGTIYLVDGDTVRYAIKTMTFKPERIIFQVDVDTIKAIVEG